VALMFMLAPGRRDVRVPTLGHPPARELHCALIERRLELQEEHRLLYIEDPSHEVSKLAAEPRCSRADRPRHVDAGRDLQQISFN